MNKRMLVVGLSIVFALVALVPAAADAQWGYRPSQPGMGENYGAEFAIGLWKPDPDIVVRSDRLAVIGSEVDAVDDLGIESARFRELRFVVRPARKHKIRFEYIPIKYGAESTLERSITFGGTTYSIGLPVNSAIEFKSYRFGYEWDFIQTSRAFVGVIGEVKYVNAKASITSPVGGASAESKAPIPAIGATARGYLGRFVSLTGEVSFFKLPNRESAEYWGKYIDYDLYATLNFSNNVGVQGGFRSLDLEYRAEGDSAVLNLRGLYARAVFRF